MSFTIITTDRVATSILLKGVLAQSHVGDSFRIPTVTHQINALGVITTVSPHPF